MRQFQYGKREANLIKGIAILMMFTHHLFGFPEWITDTNMYEGITINGIILEQAVGIFCKICVGLFAFTSGYAIFVNEKQYKNIWCCIEKGFKFLIHYWIIFAIFLVLGILLKEPLPMIGTLVMQCFGIHTATGFNWSYNTSIHPIFAWYVSFYLLFLILYTFLKRVSKLNFWIDNIIYGIVFHGAYFVIMHQPFFEIPSDLNAILYRFATWGQIAMVGYLFAKYDMFQKVDVIIRKYVKPYLINICSVIIIFVIMIYRHKIGMYVFISTFSLDIVYVPILIYALINIINWIHSSLVEKNTCTTWNI